MKELKKDLKTKKFRRLYVLCGDEKYLVNYYEKRLLEAVGEGADTFEGKGCDADDIINAAESLPFLAEKRVVLVRESGLFAAGRKTDSEKMAAYVKDIPETTILIFVEYDIDKRGRLYKAVKDSGHIVEMNHLEEKDLTGWICTMFKQNGKYIEPATAIYLARYVGGGMNNIYAEIQKLTDYKADGAIQGDTIKNTIKREDIDAVCVKSLDTKIFDLVGAIGTKDARTALDIYANMILMKESPLMVLAMIARQFRNILHCGHLVKRLNINDIAAKTGLRSFVVRECINQSRNFTEASLIGALNACLDTDVDIKTGKMNDRLAVELLIIKYSTK